MDSQTKFVTLFTSQQIAARIDELASEIQRDYRDKHPLLLGVLKGSFIFLADMVRRLDFPLELDFIRVASYGAGQESSGQVRLVSEPVASVRDRHVLLVEDIIDTGLTTGFIRGWLEEREAASIKLCSLLDKPSRRQRPIEVDYRGFTVPDRFLVGYGLDLNEEHRNLPGIYFIDGE
jgi:hypoxanthine phosphoribosyltransferase